MDYSLKSVNVIQSYLISYTCNFIIAFTWAIPIVSQLATRSVGAPSTLALRIHRMLYAKFSFIKRIICAILVSFLGVLQVHEDLHRDRLLFTLS